MAKFKAGDRVRIVHTDFPNRPGLQVGCVKEIVSVSDNCSQLRSDDPTDLTKWNFYEDELEPLSDAPKKWLIRLGPEDVWYSPEVWGQMTTRDKAWEFLEQSHAVKVADRLRSGDYRWHVTEAFEPKVDMDKVRATSEEDIARHEAEDDAEAARDAKPQTVEVTVTTLDAIVDDGMRVIADGSKVQMAAYIARIGAWAEQMQGKKWL